MESCKNGLCAFDGKIWTKIMKIWWNHVTTCYSIARWTWYQNRKLAAHWQQDSVFSILWYWKFDIFAWISKINWIYSRKLHLSKIFPSLFCPKKKENLSEKKFTHWVWPCLSWKVGTMALCLRWQFWTKSWKMMEPACFFWLNLASWLCFS